VVSGCSGDGYPVDGTVIEGCTPMTVNDRPTCDPRPRYECLLGPQTWVYTTESEPDAASCWPCELERLQTSPTTTAPAVTPTNAAAKAFGLHIARAAGTVMGLAVGAVIGSTVGASLVYEGRVLEGLRTYRVLFLLQ